MSTNTRKTRLIADYERDMAGRLALRVLDKPKPPLWMIFVPVFFVFFAQKMRHYSKAREDFVENYVKPRGLALDAAHDAIETGTPLEPSRILEKAGAIPEHSSRLFADWMTALTDHYRTLLDARGDTAQALIRSGYRSKTEYLLACNVLNRTENAFNESLMTKIEGDSQEIRSVVARMHESVADLRRQEADAIFG